MTASCKSWRGPNTVGPHVYQSWRERVPRVAHGDCACAHVHITTRAVASSLVDEFNIVDRTDSAIRQRQTNSSRHRYECSVLCEDSVGGQSSAARHTLISHNSCEQVAETMYRKPHSVAPPEEGKGWGVAFPLWVYGKIDRQLIC